MTWDVHEKLELQPNGEILIKRGQLVGDHVDYCKARQNEGLHGLPDFKLKASFPVTVVEAYCSDKGITLQEWFRNPEHVKAMVNDPALADLRIAPGRM